MYRVILGMQVCKNASMEVRKYARMQTFKYASIQVGVRVGRSIQE